MSLVIWEDSQISPGARWRAEICHALSDATIAVLMVSADFLASDFVMSEELPAILRSAEASGTVIMPLLLAPSLFTQSVLNCFQAVNSGENPLSKLSTYKSEEVFVKLATSIASAIR